MQKCLPKLSRAKFLLSHDAYQVLISVTAATRGQQVEEQRNAGKQTRITLDNIEKLISEGTLTQLNRKNLDILKIDFIRIYIKNPGDYRKVVEICKKRLPGINSIYVVTNICRENLLVEIEAIAG